MSAQDPIRAAMDLPSGARFYKCALQVNPHHYSGTYRGKQSSLDETAYIEGLLTKAVQEHVSVLAVTDHNHVGGVEAIRERADEHGIHVFPGFELSSTEGIHVLCLYAPGTETDQLERYLGEFGLRDTSASADLCRKSFKDVLSWVRGQGGITIAAHITNDNGLLRTLEGQPRIKAWQDDNLLAVQIPGSVADLPPEIAEIVENRNADYKRSHSPEDRMALAVVNAKDIAEPDDLEDPAATCWIKMSEVSIEGLRQAFLDPGSRIRLNSDPVPDEHAELVALAWEGGFLDGAAVHFNQNLNVLIGGRGAGKSTVVESLRSVLDLESLGDEARKTHEGIVRHVLRSGTKISLLVRSHRPSPREYRVERTIPNPPIVRNEKTGEIVNLTPKGVLASVELYGQHEISELTKSPEKLTRLLERFVERDDSLARRKRELRQELQKSRSQVADGQRELRQIEDRLAALPGLQETLKSYQEAGLEERLKEQSQLVREERILDTIPERLAPFHECLEQLRREAQIDRAFLSPKALQGLPGAEILSEANEVLERLSNEIQKIAKALDKALAQADEGLSGIRTTWMARKKQVQADYEKKLRELQKSSVDGEEFIRLRKRIEELKPLKDRDVTLRRLAAELAERRRSLLAEWEDVKGQEFRTLDRARKRVSKKLSGRVRVNVEFAGNREPLIRILREEVGGRLSEAINAVREAEELSLSDFVAACREGSETLRAAYGIPPAQGDRLNQASEDVLMQIEELDLPPTTTIELNTASPDERENWQALHQLSTGQKATAVLLLLLLESDAPLIVDQPEDDLDNRFITEGVVPRMREEKRRRQFVFSTHNANIPVLGDAELILGLSASGEAAEGKARIATEHMGSIDTRPVRELVEELLEGGHEAFERRRRKYGF